MTTVNVRRIGVASFGKLIGVWAAIVGLVTGVMGAVVAVASLLVNNHYGVFAGLFYSIGVVLLAVVVYPAVLFAIGWIQGAVIALIFNIVISGSGGLELVIDPSEEIVPIKN
jgi:hypothetical protein